MEENPVEAGLVRFARDWPWTGGYLQEQGCGRDARAPGGYRVSQAQVAQG